MNGTRRCGDMVFSSKADGPGVPKERKNNQTELSWGFQAGAAGEKSGGCQGSGQGGGLWKPHRRGKEVKTGRVESKTTMRVREQEV